MRGERRNEGPEGGPGRCHQLDSVWSTVVGGSHGFRASCVCNVCKHVTWRIFSPTSDSVIKHSWLGLPGPGFV